MTGSPLKPSAGVAQRYNRELDKTIGRMRKDYEKEVGKVLSPGARAGVDVSLASRSRIVLNELARKWSAEFNKILDALTDKMILQVNRTSKAQLGQSLRELSGGLTVKTPELPKGLEDKVKAAIAENTRLIKSIPASYHDKVSGTVMRSIQEGGAGAREIYSMAMKNITKEGINIQKRASLIARTETAKLSTMMQTERLKSVGVTKVRWHHSHGGAEPRELHQRYDGQIFDLDDPPIIDERTGARGWGGMLPNCRCYIVPVVEFAEGEEVE